MLMEYQTSLQQGIYDKQKDIYGKQEDIYGKQEDIYGKQEDIYGKQQEIYDQQQGIYGKQEDIYDEQRGINDKSRLIMVNLVPSSFASPANQWIGISGYCPSQRPTPHFKCRTSLWEQEGVSGGNKERGPQGY